LAAPSATGLRRAGSWFFDLEGHVAASFASDLRAHQFGGALGWRVAGLRVMPMLRQPAPLLGDVGYSGAELWLGWTAGPGAAGAEPRNSSANLKRFLASQLG